MIVLYRFCYLCADFSYILEFGVVLPQLSWKSGVFPCFSVEGFPFGFTLMFHGWDFPSYIPATLHYPALICFSFLFHMGFLGQRDSRY